MSAGPRPRRPVRLLHGPLAAPGRPAGLHPALTLLAPSDAADSDASDFGSIKGRSGPRPGPFAGGRAHRDPLGAGSMWGGAGGRGVARRGVQGDSEYAVFTGDRAWSLPPSLEPAAPGPAPGGLGTSRSSAVAHGLGWGPADSDSAPAIITAITAVGSGSATGRAPPHGHGLPSLPSLPSHQHAATSRGPGAGVRALLLGFVDSDSDATHSEEPGSGGLRGLG